MHTFKALAAICLLLAVANADGYYGGYGDYGYEDSYGKDDYGYGGDSYGKDEYGYDDSYGKNDYGSGDSYGKDDYGYGGDSYGKDDYGYGGDSYGKDDYGYGDDDGYGDSYGDDKYGYGSGYGKGYEQGYGDDYGYGDSYGKDSYGDDYGYGDSYGKDSYGDDYGYGDSYGKDSYGDDYGYGDVDLYSGKLGASYFGKKSNGKKSFRKFGGFDSGSSNGKNDYDVRKGYASGSAMAGHSNLYGNSLYNRKFVEDGGLVEYGKISGSGGENYNDKFEHVNKYRTGGKIDSYGEKKHKYGAFDAYGLRKKTGHNFLKRKLKLNGKVFAVGRLGSFGKAKAKGNMAMKSKFGKKEYKIKNKGGDSYY